MSALTELLLDSNQLNTLPVSIGRLTELMCLNLDGNRLSTLPPEIAGMTALQELWIHDNKVYRFFFPGFTSFTSTRY